MSITRDERLRKKVFGWPGTPNKNDVSKAFEISEKCIQESVPSDDKKEKTYTTYRTDEFQSLVLVQLPPTYLRAKLVFSFSVRIVRKGYTNIITVPKGYITDYASVPRVFWSILPPWGKYAPAAVVHDYLCDHENYTRKFADHVFRYLMIQLKVKPWKIHVMFAAVRIAGISGKWFKSITSARG